MVSRSGKRSRMVWGLLVLVGIAFSAAAVRAADHRDSPLTKATALLDINDVYAFQSHTNPNNTVIITTVVPLAGVLNAPIFSPFGMYEINVDNDGDAVENVSFRFVFSDPNAQGRQRMVLQVIKNHVTQFTAQGMTGDTTQPFPGVTVSASLFDDPFFFDLNAFNAFKASGNPQAFCHPGVNFFKGLNTMALVMEVPNTMLRSFNSQTKVGIWARTVDTTGRQIDRMGRPAINTALIPDALKDSFNFGSPSTDRRNFRSTVIATLVADGNTPSFAALLTDILLPDMLTFDTSSGAGFLNGRQLLDDVIDAELGLILGHFPHGAVTTDCVGNDSNFLSRFPYLGPPNR
jgi:hypothetical protein